MLRRQNGEQEARAPWTLVRRGPQGQREEFVSKEGERQNDLYVQKTALDTQRRWSNSGQGRDGELEHEPAAGGAGMDNGPSRAAADKMLPV